MPPKRKAAAVQAPAKPAVVKRPRPAATAQVGQKRKLDDSAAACSTNTPLSKRAHVDGNIRDTGRTLTENESVAMMTGREMLYADVEFDEWDPNTFYKDALMVVILGKRNTGKTVLMTNILYANRRLWAYGLVITKTKFNGYWQKFFPAHCILNDYHPDILEKFFDVQQPRSTMRGINGRSVIIFDDMASNTALKYSEQLTRMAYNGRHYLTDVYYLTQDVVKASTAMRRNADLFLMMTTTGMNSLKVVYEEFASIDFPKMAHFIGAMMRITENYGALVIDNSDPNKRGRERFAQFTGKDTPELPTFTMFCPAAWGVRTAEERAQKAAEQRLKYPTTIKYERSTLETYKNRDQTIIAQDQVARETRSHRLNEQKSATSLFATLAQRHSSAQPPPWNRRVPD